MGKFVNIGGADDKYFRYKMPPVEGKIEGRGNGIKTVIVNASAVELGAVSKYDARVGSGTVNGAHDTNVLQELVNKFVDTFVICPCCKLPETSLHVGKKKNIIFICKACGRRSQCNTAHKLCTFICNNPPDEKNGIVIREDACRKTKEERRAAKN